jgi:nitrogen fixation NifU-like protein
MFDQLRDLYQEVILDHGKAPRNFRVPEHPSHKAEGHNPLCGDQLNIFLELDEDGVVRDVGFQGAGCAISTASASMMTEAIKGKPLAEVEQMFERFHDLVAGPEVPDAVPPDLGKLAVFAGVREFPMRVKCATLAWHTMKAALEQPSGGSASTE